jgi:GGDEF domain-containing protein
MVHLGTMRRFETYIFALMMYLGFIPSAVAGEVLTGQFEQYFDPSGQLTIADMVKPQRAASFRVKSDDKILTWGGDGVLWLKGKLPAGSTSQKLIFTQANLEEFTLYEKRPDGSIITHARPQITGFGQVQNAVEGEIFVKLTAPLLHGRLILEDDAEWAADNQRSENIWIFALVTLWALAVVLAVFSRRKNRVGNWRWPFIVAGLCLGTVLSGPWLAHLSIYILFSGYAVAVILLVLGFKKARSHQKLPSKSSEPEPLWPDLAARLDFVMENLGSYELEQRCLDRPAILKSGALLLAELRMVKSDACALLLALDDAEKLEDALGRVGLERAMTLFSKLIAELVPKDGLLGRYDRSKYLLLLRNYDERRASNMIEELGLTLERQALLIDGLRLSLGMRASLAALDGQMRDIKAVLRGLDEFGDGTDQEMERYEPAVFS